MLRSDATRTETRRAARAPCFRMLRGARCCNLMRVEACGPLPNKDTGGLCGLDDLTVVVKTLHSSFLPYLMPAYLMPGKNDKTLF